MCGHKSDEMRSCSQTQRSCEILLVPPCHQPACGVYLLVSDPLSLIDKLPLGTTPLPRIPSRHDSRALSSADTARTTCANVCNGKCVHVYRISSGPFPCTQKGGSADRKGSREGPPENHKAVYEGQGQSRSRLASPKKTGRWPWEKRGNRKQGRREKGKQKRIRGRRMKKSSAPWVSPLQ